MKKYCALILSVILAVSCIDSLGLTAFAADDFNAMRAKWELILTGGTEIDTSDPRVESKVDVIGETGYELWNTMDKSADRTTLWSDIGSLTAKTNDGTARINECYTRLKNMTIAYSTKGSSLKGNTQLRDDVINAIDWLFTNYYDVNLYPELSTVMAGYSPYGNWWNWQIGIPMDLNDIMCLLYDEMPQAHIEKNLSSIFAYCVYPDVLTAANALWTSKVHIIGGILKEDSTVISNGISGIKDEFKYVTSNDGFYVDGSFIQHYNKPYAGGYGRTVIGVLSDMLYLVSGTDHEASTAQKNMLSDWFTNSYEPLIYDGAMMDMVRGRQISIHSVNDIDSGNNLIRSLLPIADIIEPEKGAYMKSRIKYWIQQDPNMSIYDRATLFDTVELNNLMNDSSVEAAEKLVKHKNFGSNTNYKQ